MGQFFIVQGADGQVVRQWFAAGLAAYRALGGLEPCDQAVCGNTAAATFQPLAAPGLPIVRGPRPGAWILGAGCPFDGPNGGAHGLRSLSSKLLGGESLESAPLETRLEDFDGSAAIACHDASGALALITDRLGTLHVYRVQAGACTLFSTSSLVLAALTRPDWDTVSWREFLATGTVFEQRTLFRGMEKLPPARVLLLRDGCERWARTYWSPATAMYDRAPFRGDVPALAAALEKAVDTIGRNFPRPVMDLTGGFDSRVLLAALLRSGQDFATVVNGDAGDADVQTAGLIAGAFGLQHTHQTVAPESPAEWWERAKASLPLCDGEYDVLLYARPYTAHTRLAQRFQISINGSNGELIKGYWWELLLPFIGSRGHFDEREVAAKRFVFAGEPRALFAFRPDEDLADHFAGVIRRANARLSDYPNTAKMDNVYLTLRMQRWQGRIASATSRIWPCLSPFMFRRPMELALSAPPSRRVRHRMTRRLIEYLNPRLAAMPLAQGYPALPLRLTTAHKFGPLAMEVARKVQHRVWRKASNGARPVNPIRGLWEQEEVREICDPGSMRTGALYDGRALREFLAASRDTSFPQHARFGRVLTLELLARSVQQISCAASTNVNI